ncbi:MAG: glycosyltransferase [Pedobacter sp.]|jgi:glycosyltransferase involved in cell wall biosynthesis|uniref:glycosyltransferase n=1 Tax=Pedobacter sp. TaxID=1411316 RepID=UPI00356A9ADC
MKIPLVSIIIPFYNAEDFLVETLQSAINQTWENKEIILIDDGSTDGSFLKVKSFKNEKVKLIQQQKNKGASAARNLGLSCAKGDYIQFLDADDLLSPNKIEKQVLALQNEPNKIAVCSTVHFKDTENHFLRHPSAFEENFIYNTDSPIYFITKLWGGYDQHASMIQPNAWLTPMNLIKSTDKWDENLSVDDDGEYFARVILNSKGIVKVEHVFNYYRKQNTQKSLSAQKSHNHFKSQLLSTLSKKHELLSRTATKEAKQAIHRQLFELIVKSYPKYPSIYKKALKELPDIESNYYQPVIGGPKIQKIVKLFGWKVARIIQYILTQK